MAPFVRVLLILFLPISYPISKVLDYMLGKGHSALLRRAELKTFVDFHGIEAGKGGDLTHDETTIIAGALQLTEKTAKDAMTPISNAFALDLDAPLTLRACGFWFSSFSIIHHVILCPFNIRISLYRDTLNAIMAMGHSRVPVYAENPRNIIGLVLVKNLLMIDKDEAVTLRKMMIRKIPRVSEDMPLYDILNEFQKGHSHITVVYKDVKETLKNVNESETLEASTMKDEKPGGPATEMKNSGQTLDSDNAQIDLDNHDGGQKTKSPPATPAFKKRHRGCSFCILDIENSLLPVFPPSQVVVGVITMEDVIEELLQEEILDETDEYVNIHNRIKVNMHASQENVTSFISPEPSPERSSAPIDLGSTLYQEFGQVDANTGVSTDR